MVTQQAHQAFGDASSMQRLIRYVHGRLGINLRGKESLIRQRLQSLLWEHQIATLRALCDLLETGPDESDLALDLLDRMTTHHTYFFRDAGQFVPLVADAVSGDDNEQFRIWCAACSTGEEPYTLAILLAEKLGMDRFARRVSILATDISQRAIDHGEHGEYNKGAAEHVPEGFRSKYLLRRSENCFAVHDAIRRCCVFRRLNLQLRRYPLRGPFDWIVCRNVLIYFDEPTREVIVESLAAVSKPGTGLLLGLTETISPHNRYWAAQGARTFRRRT